MQKPDLILEDHEIIPISAVKFGVIVSRQEAVDLALDGYEVQTRRLAPQEKPVHYIEVTIGIRQRGSAELTLLETVGRGDIVISPVPWRKGSEYGTKAYMKSVRCTQDSARHEIAWRIWCWHHGFNETEGIDLVTNWMRFSDSDLHPDDKEIRDALLKIVDAAIELGRKETKESA